MRSTGTGAQKRTDSDDIQPPVSMPQGWVPRGRFGLDHLFSLFADIHGDGIARNSTESQNDSATPANNQDVLGQNHNGRDELFQHPLMKDNLDLSAKVQALQSKIRKLKAEKSQWSNDESQLTDELARWKDQARKIRDSIASEIKFYMDKHELNHDRVVAKDLGPTINSLCYGSKCYLEQEKDIQSLQHRIQSLQEQLFASVDKVQAIPDDQFVKDFSSLASSIRTLSRTAILPEDLNDLLQEKSLLLLKDVSGHNWAVRRYKKYLTEAWVWSVLLRLVFETPFATHGHAAEAVSAGWVMLFGSQHLHGWPLPSERCEKWRVSTAEQLAEHATTDKRRAEHHTLTSEVLQYHLRSSQSRTQTQNIVQLVDKAVALAVQMSLQRCRLQVTFPAVTSAFKVDEMKSLPADDGEDMTEGTVAFVVNPGLTKWGDAKGDNLGDRYDIVPALVKLVPLQLKDKRNQEQANLDQYSHVYTGSDSKHDKGYNHPDLEGIDVCDEA